MTTNTRLRAFTKRRRRGSQFIEFAILLPVFIAMILFVLGSGEIVITQTGLQDAMQQFVREGAQTGGLIGCTNGGTCDENTSPAYQNLYSSIAQMPGGSDADIVSVTVSSGGGEYSCTAASPYVTATITYNPDTLLPIVATLMRIPDRNWELHATATARCDVAE
jgi:Flp pilus assembly protein TadG